jgi:hypothetical protein
MAQIRVSPTTLPHSGQRLVPAGRIVGASSPGGSMSSASAAALSAHAQKRRKASVGDRGIFSTSAAVLGGSSEARPAGRRVVVC